jgi:hypothetical protein
MKTLPQYEQQELNVEYKYLASRQKLGAWKDDSLPDVDTCIDRISWVLNGSYGHGAMLYAQQVIDNRLSGKTGKNVDKAWLAIGRELIMLVALHDTTEYTARKITECWKKQGIDFAQVNANAVKEVKRFIAETKE